MIFPIITIINTAETPIADNIIVLLFTSNLIDALNFFKKHIQNYSYTTSLAANA